MNDQPERRLSPTEREHELAMAHATRQLEAPQHSLEVTRNAKGEYQFSLTTRGVDLGELVRNTFEAVALVAAEYPREGGAA